MPANDDANDSTDTDSYARSDIDVEELLSEEALDGVARALDTHSPMMPLLVPPVPLSEVPDAVGEEDEYTGRLFALADLAHGFNKITDPTMAHDEEWDEEAEEWVELDEPEYPITRESVPEVKLASHAVYAAYHRELEALAEELDVADDPAYEKERNGEEYYDYKEAIKDYFGYDPTSHDYEKPVRDIADDLGVEPAAVADCLRDEFGEDVDVFERNYGFESVGLEELKDALGTDDEEDTGE